MSVVSWTRVSGRCAASRGLPYDCGQAAAAAGLRPLGGASARPRPYPYCPFLRQDDKPPVLRPGFTHVLGQFTGAQAGDHIAPGFEQFLLHEHVMVRGPWEIANTCARASGSHPRGCTWLGNSRSRYVRMASMGRAGGRDMRRSFFAGVPAPAPWQREAARGRGPGQRRQTRHSRPPLRDSVGGWQPERLQAAAAARHPLSTAGRVLARRLWARQPGSPH